MLQDLFPQVAALRPLLCKIKKKTVVYFSLLAEAVKHNHRPQWKLKNKASLLDWAVSTDDLKVTPVQSAITSQLQVTEIQHFCGVQNISEIKEI